MKTLIDRRRAQPFRDYLDSPSWLEEQPDMPEAWRPTKPIQISRLGVYLAALAFSLSFLYGFCLYVIGPVLHQILARIF